VAPIEIDGEAGVTAIDTSVGALTVNVVEPLIPPELALIVVEPADAPLARPVLLTVATEVLDDCHVAVAVRSCVLLSL
jgi:hypothetical protein